MLLNMLSTECMLLKNLGIKRVILRSVDNNTSLQSIFQMYIYSRYVFESVSRR